MNHTGTFSELHSSSNMCDLELLSYGKISILASCLCKKTFLNILSIKTKNWNSAYSNPCSIPVINNFIHG